MRRIRDFFETVVVFAIFGWPWRDKLPRGSALQWIRLALHLPFALLFLPGFLLLLRNESETLRPL